MSNNDIVTLFQIIYSPQYIANLGKGKDITISIKEVDEPTEEGETSLVTREKGLEEYKNTLKGDISDKIDSIVSEYEDGTYDEVVTIATLLQNFIDIVKLSKSSSSYITTLILGLRRLLSIQSNLYIETQDVNPEYKSIVIRLDLLRSDVDKRMGQSIEKLTLKELTQVVKKYL